MTAAQHPTATEVLRQILNFLNLWRAGKTTHESTLQVIDNEARKAKLD
jgi:hypothetical protein